MKLSNGVYDFLKKIVQIVLPALASLYFGLAKIWGLPYGEEIVGTLAIIATFLGAILGISTRNYNNSDAAFDGKVVVTDKPDGGKLYSLELNKDVDQLQDMESLRFKVASGG